MANEEATGGGCKRTCRTVVQAVTPLFLCLRNLSMVVHATSPKPFPSPLARARRRRTTADEKPQC